MNKVDSKNPPSIKDCPSGYYECEDGYWTYSNRAIRCGYEGWMFHKWTKNGNSQCGIDSMDWWWYDSHTVLVAFLGVNKNDDSR